MHAKRITETGVQPRWISSRHWRTATKKPRR